GTVLQEYNSGDIPTVATPQWRQYGFYFTTTSTSTEVVLRMTNNARGGIGNDLALDDITFRPCGPDVSGTIVGYGDSVGVCVEEPSAYTLTASVSSGFAQPVFQWQVSQDRGRSWRNLPGATALSYIRPSSGAGSYWYRLMTTEQTNSGRTQCGVHSNILIVEVHPPPFVSAGPDRTSLSGTPVVLQGRVDTPFTSFYWSPAQYLNNPNLLTPTVSLVQDQAYTLYATSAYGCRNKDEVLVRVADGIYVPNAFTPNNDGLNDHWRIPYLDPGLGATVRVFNRYGQVVYTVTADNVDWDGAFRSQPQPAGTYVYQIQFPDGRPVMKGTFSLIR
nr:T9SS type B sorting domain-containing protein [Chitinophagaceae bacterium]